MCFNEYVSVITGSFCWYVALRILARMAAPPELKNDAIFLLIYSSIQFVDAILHLNKSKNMINKLLTSVVIPSILSAQLLFNANVQTAIPTPLALSLAVSVSMYIFWRFHGYSTFVCGLFQSPIWSGKEITLLEFSLFSLLLFYPNWERLLITWVLIVALNLLFKGGYGSMWCAVACVYSVYLNQKVR
jgi:hypothetical protein